MEVLGGGGTTIIQVVDCSGNRILAVTSGYDDQYSTWRSPAIPCWRWGHISPNFHSYVATLRVQMCSNRSPGSRSPG